jgi:hypothetical protein
MNAATGVILLATLGVAPIVMGSQDPARELLGLAIVAAGGAENLQRQSVFAWHGKGTIHAARGQTIRIEGDWRVEPPDRAIVETFIVGSGVDQGPGSTRSMGIDNGRGWWRIGGDEQPMDAATLANERDQFYLYHLLRLTPLLGADYTLTPLPPDAVGRPALRVRHAGRRDADLYFDRDYRIVRLTTTIFHLGLKTEVPEELRLTGTVEAGGIKWPQRIQILQRGELFFDLELTKFRTLAKLE